MVTEISKISDRPVTCHAALVVIHGVELGRKFDLQKQETTIGRSARSDIQVDQESVSRSHARIFSDGTRVQIKDLGSTNGTFVNDVRAQNYEPLRNGDLLKIGGTIFKFIAGNNIESAYHDEIYRLTTIDGLTQVYNRRHFEEALEREISRCHRYGRDLSLIILDIDRFKDINDGYGHLAGDAALKQLAACFRPKIRREDIFARYGGEEFALLLPELSMEGALALAEKLRKMVQRQRFTVGAISISMTVSLGIASLSKKYNTSAKLLAQADAMLYQAKRGGRNRCCV